MATISQPRIITKPELVAADLPEQVTIALASLAGTAKEGLLALSVGVGLAVVQEIFQGEALRLVGPRGKHDPTPTAMARNGASSHRAAAGWR